MEEVGYSLEDFADVDPDNPASYDVFDEMFAAVKAAYPDMTAIAGQQALPSLCTFDSLSDSFGVLEDRGQTTTVTNYYESQQFKDLVTISKRWYDAGYYSADAVTNQDTGETLLKAGNLFSFFVGIKPNTAQEKLAQTGYEVTVIPVAGQTVYSSYGYNALWLLPGPMPPRIRRRPPLTTTGLSRAAISTTSLTGASKGFDWVEDENGQAAFPEGMDGQNYRYHNDLGWIYPNQTAGHSWAVTPKTSGKCMKKTPPPLSRVWRSASPMTPAMSPTRPSPAPPSTPSTRRPSGSARLTTSTPPSPPITRRCMAPASRPSSTRNRPSWTPGSRKNGNA